MVKGNLCTTDAEPPPYSNKSINLIQNKRNIAVELRDTYLLEGFLATFVLAVLGGQPILGLIEAMALAVVGCPWTIGIRIVILSH